MKIKAVVDGVERDVEIDENTAEKIGADIQIKHAIDDIKLVMRDFINSEWEYDATEYDRVWKEADDIVERNYDRVKKEAEAYLDSLYTDWYEVLECRVRKLYDDCKDVEVQE